MRVNKTVRKCNNKQFGRERPKRRRTNEQRRFESVQVLMNGCQCYDTFKGWRTFNIRTVNIDCSRHCFHSSDLTSRFSYFFSRITIFPIQHNFHHLVPYVHISICSKKPHNISDAQFFRVFFFCLFLKLFFRINFPVRLHCVFSSLIYFVLK